MIPIESHVDAMKTLQSFMLKALLWVFIALSVAIPLAVILDGRQPSTILYVAPLWFFAAIYGIRSGGHRALVVKLLVWSSLPLFPFFLLKNGTNPLAYQPLLVVMAVLFLGKTQGLWAGTLVLISPLCLAFLDKIEFEPTVYRSSFASTAIFVIALSTHATIQRLLLRLQVETNNVSKNYETLLKVQSSLAAATRSGGVGLFTEDADHNSLTVNSELKELIGAVEHKGDVIPVEVLTAVVAAEDRKLLSDELEGARRAVSDTSIHSIEVRCHLPRKGLRYLHFNISVADAESGQRFVSGSVIDVTSIRSAESRLRDELAKQDQLFAIIGHELRTPASALKMLIEDQKIAELEPHGGVIAETADHLLRVLDDMRIITQPERVLESPEVRGSVPAMVERSLPLLGRLLVEQGLSVYVEASQNSHSHCVVREQLLRQITLNIVKNAALHANATAMRIGIEAEDLGDSIRFTLEFADNGKGIGYEQQEHIFDAFGRGDTEAEGTGLGLHISRTYARNILNGDLAYRDNDPHGAIFTLTAVFNKTSLELEKAEQEAVKIAQMNLLEGLTVLYAEDSPVLRMTTVKQLQMKGATVLVATDGREALEIADNQPFDLVITDIFMPNVDGYGVTSGIRERGFDCPIIGVTAAVVGDETDRLIACGANAALAKPLDMAALQKVVADHRHLLHVFNKSEDDTAHRRRVLVIDDDPVTLARFEVLLEDEFDVRTQESALKATDDFRAFDPDVILCDVNMPEMNGFEVFKEIHSLDPSVPIIQMSSTRASEHYLSIAKTMGAAEIMDKTSDGDEVLRLIHQVLQTNTEVQK